ncbi:MAG: hypothetical protein EP335_18675 [Alphaproteobacteria bacterium]|nr:MAG: hypothetical protein EP335_18675 [Alphaproteobacteria bacterium]
MAEERNGVIFEFIPIGNSVRVSAVCTRTGREVSIVGDRRTSQRDLEAVALRKLRYVMNRDAEKQAGNQKGLII